MAKPRFLTRTFALLTALSLSLPNSALALRPKEPLEDPNRKSGMEEAMRSAAGTEESISKLVEFRHLAVQIRRRVQDDGEDFSGALRRILKEYPGSVEQKLLGEPKISGENLLYVIVGDKGLSQMNDPELSRRYLTSPFAHENLRVLPMVIRTIYQMAVDSGKMPETPDAIILNMDLGDTRIALLLVEQRALISRILEVTRSSTAAGAEELGRPEIPTYKRAVLIGGTGNIGRGHIAPLLAVDDFDLIFTDFNQALITEANQRDSYVVTPVGLGNPVTVNHFWGIDARQEEAVAAQGPRADWIFTTVGTNNLIKLKSVIYQFIRKRIEAGHLETLNIVFAENLPVDQPQIAALRAAVLEMAEGDDKTRQYVEEKVNFVGSGQFYDYAHGYVGWVGAVVGITVPPGIAATGGNPLSINVEGGGPYYLEVDAKELRGSKFIPSGMKPVENIRAAREKKLLIHNMGHAALAYLSAAFGITDPAEGIRDRRIAKLVRRAMMESATGLHHRYPTLFPMPELMKYIDQLMDRFANRELGDTVERIARDPLRKLEENDRLFGAAVNALQAGIVPESITLAIAAAIRYAKEVDRVPEERLAPVMELVRKHGLRLPEDDEAFHARVEQFAAGAEERTLSARVDRLAGMIRDFHRTDPSEPWLGNAYLLRSLDELDGFVRGFRERFGDNNLENYFRYMAGHDFVRTIRTSQKLPVQSAAALLAYADLLDNLREAVSRISGFPAGRMIFLSPDDHAGWLALAGRDVLVPQENEQTGDWRLTVEAPAGMHIRTDDGHGKMVSLIALLGEQRPLWEILYSAHHEVAHDLQEQRPDRLSDSRFLELYRAVQEGGQRRREMATLRKFLENPKPVTSVQLYQLLQGTAWNLMVGAGKQADMNSAVIGSLAEFFNTNAPRPIPDEILRLILQQPVLDLLFPTQYVHETWFEQVLRENPEIGPGPVEALDLRDDPEPLRAALGTRRFEALADFLHHWGIAFVNEIDADQRSPINGLRFRIAREALLNPAHPYQPRYAARLTGPVIREMEAVGAGPVEFAAGFRPEKLQASAELAAEFVRTKMSQKTFRTRLRKIFPVSSPAAGAEEFQLLPLAAASPLVAEAARIEKAYSLSQGLVSRSEFELREVLRQGGKGFGVLSGERLIGFFIYHTVPAPEGDVLVLSDYGVLPSSPMWEEALRMMAGRVREEMEKGPVDHITVYATERDAPVFEAEGFGPNRTIWVPSSDKEGERKVQEMIHVGKQMLKPLEGLPELRGPGPVEYRIGFSYAMVPPPDPLVAPFLRLWDGETVLLQGKRNYLVRAEHAGLSVLESDRFHLAGAPYDKVVVPQAGSWVVARRHPAEGLDAPPVNFPGENIQLSRSPFGLILGWQGDPQGKYVVYKLTEMDKPAAGAEEISRERVAQAVEQFRAERDPAKVQDPELLYYLEREGTAFAPALSLLETGKQLGLYSFVGVVETRRDYDRLAAVLEANPAAQKTLQMRILVIEEQPGADRQKRYDTALRKLSVFTSGMNIQRVTTLEPDLLAQLNLILADFGYRLPEDPSVQEAAGILLQAA